MVIPRSINIFQTAHRYRENNKEEHTYGNYAAEIEPKVIKDHESQAVDLSCSPGDVILFSNLLFHRGGQNRVGTSLNRIHCQK